MTYVIYSKAGEIDSVEAETGFTIEQYLEECHDNGCYYDNEDELYLLEVDDDEEV